MLYHGTKDDRAKLRRKIHRSTEVKPGVAVQPAVVTSYEVRQRTDTSFPDWSFQVFWGHIFVIFYSTAQNGKNIWFDLTLSTINKDWSMQDLYTHEVKYAGPRVMKVYKHGAILFIASLLQQLKSWPRTAVSEGRRGQWVTRNQASLGLSLCSKRISSTFFFHPAKA